MGTSIDGLRRNLTENVTGTTYMSTNSEIVGVSENGLVRARHVGIATITSSNGGLVASIAVRVLSAKGDADGNGIVDEYDVARFIQGYTGPLGPEVAPPGNTDQSTFDFDDDGDIDCADWMGLINVWNGSSTPPLFPVCAPPRADFDGDGDVDLHDQGALIGCTNGPGVTILEACSAKDLDDDGDVDQSDFGILQRCFSGAGIVADPACSP